MKTKQSLVCGFLTVMFALAFGACSAAKGQKLTGTDSFEFAVIDNGTAYSVGAGTATEGTVNIPAYYRPNAESDYLPVTAIGSFRGCRNIIKITIPASVTSIGDNAFEDCTNLTSITIPKGVTSIGNHVFDNCTSLPEITIPANVTSIGWRAFYKCSSLTSITIPASVTEINSYAFGDWTASQTINIEGHASQAAADRAWGYGSRTVRGEIQFYGWRAHCNAKINYLGQ